MTHPMAMIDLLQSISFHLKNRFSEQVKHEGSELSYAQCRILMMMYRRDAEKYNQSYLVQKLQRSKSLVTRWLTALDQLGLIKRQREGREIFLSLTEPGQLCCQKLYQIQRELESELLQGLPPKRPLNSMLAWRS
ncbi:MarR family transcriptional regulator [Dongshaea marina]|uniref:MarR family transcriptional regulator n=1 Tax=Dongshaea marina TaxID=2047966 RepID=UPI000D3E1586|nr:MarR family transcriptional regulator [Dongshaea marina]